MTDGGHDANGELTPEEEHFSRKAFLGAGLASAGAAAVGLPETALAASAHRTAHALRRSRIRTVVEHALKENVHEWQTVLNTFDEPRYEIISTGATHTGRKDVLAYYIDGRTTFPDQRNSDYRIHYSAGFEAGSTGKLPGGNNDAAKNRPCVILEFRLQGTFKAPLSGIPPNGKKFDVRFTAFFFFNRGSDKIVVERVYGDAGTLLIQLGILPALYHGWPGSRRLKKW